MLGSCCRRVTFMWPIEVARHVVLWSLPDIYGWLLTCLDIQACQMCTLKHSGFQVFVIGQMWYYGMCYLSRLHCCLVINIWSRDNAVYPLELSFRATRHLNHRHSVYLISCSWLLSVPNVYHFFVVKTSDINSPSFTASKVVIDMFRSCHSFSFCHLLPDPYTQRHSGLPRPSLASLCTICLIWIIWQEPTHPVSLLECQFASTLNVLMTRV